MFRSFRRIRLLWYCYFFFFILFLFFFFFFIEKFIDKNERVCFPSKAFEKEKKNKFRDVNFNARLNENRFVVENVLLRRPSILAILNWFVFCLFSFFFVPSDFIKNILAILNWFLVSFFSLLFLFLTFNFIKNIGQLKMFSYLQVDIYENVTRTE